LAHALVQLGVLLTPVQQLRPTAPAPVPGEAMAVDSVGSGRRHQSLKPQSAAPSPPGNAPGSRRHAAKEKRKAAQAAAAAGAADS
jgi:hypothetical protein